MKRKIAGYRQDEEKHWVAELDCGHGQHVRHDPPWMERDWVTTEEGRNTRLGVELNCVRCDELALEVAIAVKAACIATLSHAYEDAGFAGICETGRWDVALSAVKDLDPSKIL